MAVQTTIRIRRDTAANWASVNPVLSAGEQGLETDTGYIKMGSGTASWNNLNYSTRPPQVDTFVAVGNYAISKQVTASVVTLTTLTNHPFAIGDRIAVATNNATIDNDYATPIIITASTSNTISYVKSSPNVALTNLSPYGNIWKMQFWTMPRGAVSVNFSGTGAGGGGGSGARRAIASGRAGGAGGGGALFNHITYAASQIISGSATLPGSATLFLGLPNGGAPGLSVTIDDTNGNSGTPGAGYAGNGGITFGASNDIAGLAGGLWNFLLRQGAQGSGGTTTVGQSNGQTSYGMWLGGAGGNGTLTTGGAAGSPVAGPSGGGGGAGASATSTVTSAGGGPGLSFIARTINPGAVGVSGGTSASPDAYGGSSLAIIPGLPGTGGGGGAYISGRVGGIGANGRNYGTGGGGGAASDNGFNSGSGGFGGDASLVITTYF